MPALAVDATGAAQKALEDAPEEVEELKESHRKKTNELECLLLERQLAIKRLSCELEDAKQDAHQRDVRMKALEEKVSLQQDTIDEMVKTQPALEHKCDVSRQQAQLMRDSCGKISQLCLVHFIVRQKTDKRMHELMERVERRDDGALRPAVFKAMESYEGLNDVIDEIKELAIQANDDTQQDMSAKLAVPTRTVGDGLRGIDPCATEVNVDMDLDIDGEISSDKSSTCEKEEDSDDEGLGHDEENVDITRTSDGSFRSEEEEEEEDLENNGHGFDCVGGDDDTMSNAEGESGSYSSIGSDSDSEPEEGGGSDCCPAKRVSNSDQKPIEVVEIKEDNDDDNSVNSSPDSDEGSVRTCTSGSNSITEAIRCRFARTKEARAVFGIPDACLRCLCENFEEKLAVKLFETFLGIELVNRSTGSALQSLEVMERVGVASAEDEDAAEAAVLDAAKAGMFPLKGLKSKNDEELQKEVRKLTQKLSGLGKTLSACFLRVAYIVSGHRVTTQVTVFDLLGTKKEELKKVYKLGKKFLCEEKKINKMTLEEFSHEFIQKAFNGNNDGLKESAEEVLSLFCKHMTCIRKKALREAWGKIDRGALFSKEENTMVRSEQGRHFIDRNVKSVALERRQRCSIIFWLFAKGDYIGKEMKESNFVNNMLKLSATELCNRCTFMVETATFKWNEKKADEAFEKVEEENTKKERELEETLVMMRVPTCQ